MRTKSYKNGSKSARAYLKKVGNTWESGFVYGGKTLFLGSFTNSSEANAWYGLMNREINKFSKRFTVGRTYPQGWFTSFISNHLQSKYYTFCGKFVPKHGRTATRKANVQARKYKKLAKRWPARERKKSLRAA